MNGKENGKRKCEKCGELVEHRYSVVLNGGNHWVCEDCLKLFKELLGDNTIVVKLTEIIVSKDGKTAKLTYTADLEGFP